MFGKQNEPTYEEKLGDPRWVDLSRKLKDARGRRCQQCGKTESKIRLTVHHGYYRPKGNPWDYEEETLWGLCWPCDEEAQALLVQAHRSLAIIWPFNMAAIAKEVSKSAHEWVYGISKEELQEILSEKWRRESLQFQDYAIDAVSASDIGPTRIDEMESEAHNAFPGIQFNVARL